jgi:hypothetical protein
MGLAERRAAKEFETQKYPKLKAAIDAAAGFEIPVEVNWKQLSIEGSSNLYADSWEKIYFVPLIEALKVICSDDMGKDALKAAIKKVVILNKDQINYGDRMAKFESGILTLDHKPTTNVGNLKERIEGIKKTLEKAL